ncbi:MAG: ABC transporter substrate-binding protein [Chloroflexi bacterium]|nr:ABC transporter substrate-binding protein [Chloroflexota bacterium]
MKHSAKSWAWRLAAALVVVSMLASACVAPTPQVVEKIVTQVVEKEKQVMVTATPLPAKKLPDEIVVGVVQPLTGSFAVFGQDGKLGAEIAIKHINDAGGIKSLGGKKLKLAVEDAGEKPDSAKLATESMISKNHPVAILGLYISRFVMAASEVTDREKVILIADALVPQVTQMGRQYLFRPGPTATNHGAMAYQFVKELAKANNVEIKSIAVLNEDSANGRANTLGATEAALKDMIPVATALEYPYDITDATQIVRQLSKSGVDVVIHTPYFNDAIVFGKAFKETGLWPQFLAGAGACGYVDPESIKALGDAAEGVSMTYSYNPAKNTPQNKKFVEDYKKIKGYIPTEGAGMNYYGAMVLYEALEYAGKNFPNDPLNPDNLRAAFLALDLKSGPAAETYPSPEIKFNAIGDNEFPGVVVLQVQKGEPKVVYPATEAEAKPVWPNPHFKK